jgi:hypothetical protein
MSKLYLVYGIPRQQNYNFVARDAILQLNQRFRQNIVKDQI